MIYSYSLVFAFLTFLVSCPALSLRFSFFSFLSAPLSVFVAVFTLIVVDNLDRSSGLAFASACT